MTFWETVERGEYVMIALAVLFILIICLWWLKADKLRKQTKSYPDLMNRIRDHVMEGDIENAIQFCASVTTPGAKIIETGLNRIGHSIEDVLSSMKEKALIEKDAMGLGIPWLRTIAVISPLLGLGGTLIGIIDQLRDLGEQGHLVDLSMLCSAIAPTIVTTVSGIGVGIFALLAYSCLETQINYSGHQLDEVASEFTDLLNEPS